MLDVGSVIAGKLRIDRILGEGGMGIVAVATHLQLDQQVAVKVMREQLAGDPTIVERFMREARAAAKLRSENVCRVSDVGQLPSGAPYIVMELLDGRDLAYVVARDPLPVATAVDYVLQACIAIAEAHGTGIVHRDLKPANLFLTKQLGGAPLVKVLDFGIAKAPSKNEPALTQTESMMGSPGYMSPEQLRSARDVDVRTDIWALGVILYQLVSARVPFPATSITELAVKVSMDPPEPLDVDPAFRAIVLRCLEKAPTDRYATVSALAAALAPFGTESARRSLAVIEQLAPRGAAEAMASTLAAADPLGRTAASIAPRPITTLQSATGHAQLQAPAAPRRSPLVPIVAIVVAGAVAFAIWGRPKPPSAPPRAAAAPESPAGSASAASQPLAEVAVLDAAVPVIRADAAAAPAAANVTKAPAPKIAPKSASKRTAAVTEIPEDWKDEASYLQTTHQYKEALALALAVLAKSPNEMHAAFIATGAYCGLGDATNARKWAAKLSAERKATAQRFGCSEVDIDLDAK